MKPRKARHTRNAKTQRRNATFRTWVLSSLTRFADYFSSMLFAIAARNSLFVFVLPSRWSSSSVPSI